MRTILSADTIGDLDGGAAREAINRAIETVVGELYRNGDDCKLRRVIIHLDMNNDGTQVRVRVKAAADVPDQVTGVTKSYVEHFRGARAALIFQSMDPNDPRQTTIDQYLNDGGAEPLEFVSGDR